jgi:hypothetical protein
MYHTKNIAALVQFFGRTCGDKKYVDKMNIWCPKEVYDIVSKQIEICKNIFKKDPEFYTEKDFREKTKREMLEEAMTVPVLIDITNNEYDNLISGCKNHNIFIQYISKYRPELKIKEKEEFKQIKCVKKSEPISEYSYELHILSIIKSIENNKKWSKDIQKINKNIDCYQLWFDYKNKKIYISLYYGFTLGV